MKTATTTTDAIIILDGPFEVHPSANDGSWAVVNSDTGSVRYDHLTQADAIEAANELNTTSDD